MRWNWKLWPALILLSSALMVHSPALIVPLPVNRFLNKLAPNVRNNILKKNALSLFCFIFNSFENVFYQEARFFKGLNHLHDIIHFSFGIISVVICEAKYKGRFDPKFYFWRAVLRLLLLILMLLQLL